VIAPAGTVSTAVFAIGGGSGKQTLLYGTTASFQFNISNSVVRSTGRLVVTNAGLTGNLLVQPGGELDLNSQGTLFLYNFALTNQGTLTWSNGLLETGGTFITNAPGALWQIAGDNSSVIGGSPNPLLFNAGTIRKVGGSGTSVLGFVLNNLPSGNIDALSGTLQLSAATTNILGGSFTATSPGVIKFTGNQTDAGGIASGTGSFQFTSGSFFLQTNPIPNLKFVSGDIYITGTSTFQNAGAIANLTLDGAALHGTNRVAGTLAVNAGSLDGQLSIQSGGQLLLQSPGTLLLYGLTLQNQGTVVWSGNALSVGSTIISNGGTWTITGDAPLNLGGSPPANFTNSGVIQKTAGSALSSSDFFGVNFQNTPSGVVIASAGTIRFAPNYTNTAGELRLNTGTFGAFSTTTVGMIGGTLDGGGIFANPAIFDGGTVSPGLGGPGLIQFTSGLTLGTNCTLSIDGTGTVPGVSYDQVSVALGALAISNATLQVTSLPAVPVGTTFVIITNTTLNPTIGTFNGLPENATLTVNGQPFRIHYSGGDGNDVVLVRDSGGIVTGPRVSGSFTNQTFKLLGLGSGSTIYTIQATTNLLRWTNIGTATGDLGGNFLFTDTNATNFRYRFYRTTN